MAKYTWQKLSNNTKATLYHAHKYNQSIPMTREILYRLNVAEVISTIGLYKCRKNIHMKEVLFRRISVPALFFVIIKLAATTRKAEHHSDHPFFKATYPPPLGRVFSSTTRLR